ncbi:MAG: GNAT family N-acetyltransferase [Lachnospiraceae bacterium]|jgi:RimJ/RimL family protein N-acetyltransferase|nr:GNAT family N-acetyltransferase [Lachnospiraceae bacterium]
MYLQYKNLTIRNACASDAQQLSAWWNDGKVMAHAGFPNGTGEMPAQITEKISHDADDIHRRLILELDHCPIGEMNYRNIGSYTAEIGIKICDFSKQNRGYGRLFLSMLIDSLFQDMGYQRIILDTNLKNTRAQHVYEALGFRKVRIRENAWRDQLGELQSSVDYELCPETFINFIAKTSLS